MRAHPWAATPPQPLEPAVVHSSKPLSAIDRWQRDLQRAPPGVALFRLRCCLSFEISLRMNLPRTKKRREIPHRGRRRETR